MNYLHSLASYSLGSGYDSGHPGQTVPGTWTPFQRFQRASCAKLQERTQGRALSPMGVKFETVARVAPALSRVQTRSGQAGGVVVDRPWTGRVRLAMQSHYSRTPSCTRINYCSTLPNNSVVVAARWASISTPPLSIYLFFNRLNCPRWIRSGHHLPVDLSRSRATPGSLPPSLSCFRRVCSMAVRGRGGACLRVALGVVRRELR